MALGKTDVLDVLNDPILARMDFWVENIHICRDTYRYVANLINNDNISIAPGPDRDKAHYYYPTNTLETQSIDPPADWDARALLLHECAHAFVDIMNLSITQLTEETAGYLVQFTYLLLKDPHYVVPPNNPAWLHFYQQVVALVKEFKLHEPRGRGARIYVNDDDFTQLRTELNHLDMYSKVKDADPSGANGVPRPMPDDDPAGGPVQITSQDDSFVRLSLQGDLLFDFNKADVKPAADKLLKHAGVLIQRNRPRMVYINGYTDRVGDTTYNQALSQRRADAVARWFLSHGILLKGMMKPNGFGVAPGGAPVGDTAGRANDRRVDIWVAK
jgi:outer membrane protein OmpA-like peptidoglycan-associated protein